MLRSAKWKRIEQPGLATGLYFDLERDPAERNDREATLQPSAKAELRRIFDSLLDQRVERASAVGMDESTKEKMRALGYLE